MKLHIPLMMLFLVACPAWAHDGPPFPINTDRIVGPCKISLWTHPDIGTGTFWVMVEALPGQTVPNDLKVQVAVVPVNHRIAERVFIAESDDRGQYISLIPFDRQEFVRARAILTSSRGGGEASATVEITPAAPKKWELYLFLVPFLLVGFLWFRALTTRRKKRKLT